MTYNLREIMQTAWAETRETMKLGYAASQLREVFASCLRNAWIKAKNAVREAAMTIDQLRMEILGMENTDRLGWDGMNRLELYKQLLRAKEVEADQAEKRAIIEGAGSQFVSVAFFKQDGSLRTMKVQPAALKSRVKGDDATPAGREAVATRKARHPHLLPVWDIEKSAIRSINLATVQTITTGGTTHSFTA